MSKLVTWLVRIPVWVWLLLAATQVLNLIAGTHRLSTLGDALRKMPDSTFYVELREHIENIRRDEQFNLAVAAVFALVFLGLALWRWSRGRSEATRAA
jgi:hypothetical protein